MPFEHDALVVYLKSLTPKGDEENEYPEINMVVQVAMGESGEHWEAALRSFMEAPGSNDEVEYAELLESMGSFFDAPLKFHRTFEYHRVNLYQSTTKLATIEPAQIHKAKIEWANDHHDTRLLFTVTARVPGETVGTLSDYLGHKLRMESVEAQQSLPLHEEG